MVGRIAFGLVFSAVACRAQTAQPQEANSTAFLRAGPGLRYQPIDEVLTGSLVDVVACTGGWCSVRYGAGFGYLAQKTLTSSRGEDLAQGDPKCFVSSQSAFHGGRDTRFCFAQPAAP